MQNAKIHLLVGTIFNTYGEMLVDEEQIRQRMLAAKDAVIVERDAEIERLKLRVLELESSVEPPS